MELVGSRNSNAVGMLSLQLSDLFSKFLHVHGHTNRGHVEIYILTGSRSESFPALYVIIKFCKKYYRHRLKIHIHLCTNNFSQVNTNTLLTIVKSIEIGKENLKLSLVTDDMILSEENLKESTKEKT